MITGTGSRIDMYGITTFITMRPPRQWARIQLLLSSPLRWKLTDLLPTAVAEGLVEYAAVDLLLTLIRVVLDYRV